MFFLVIVGFQSGLLALAAASLIGPVVPAVLTAQTTASSAVLLAGIYIARRGPIRDFGSG